MAKTGISWCTHSLNFLKWWCTKLSEGCKNCYMFTLVEQYPQHAADGPVWRDAAWKELRSFPSGAEVFMGDMYDLFHKDMPPEFVERHFQAVQSRPDITFLMLTKRIENIAFGEGSYFWPDNLWLGTSIENRRRLPRLQFLKNMALPKHKFVSVEPLLEDLGHVDWTGIEQVITGGESGAVRRGFLPEWAIEIRDQCAAQGVSYYHKQGGNQFPGQDRLLEGRTYDSLAWRVNEPESKPVQESLF